MSTKNIYKGSQVRIHTPERAQGVDMEAVEQQAHEAGHEAGRREAEIEFRRQRDLELLEVQTALEDARRQIESERAVSESSDATLRELVKVVSRRNKEGRERVLDHLGRLSIEVAAKIVRWSVEIDPDVIGRTLAECLDHLPSGPLRVRAHPDDVAHLERACVLDMDERVIEWTGDDSIERGGCVVDSDEETLDARINRQLDRIAETLEGTLVQSSETAEVAS